MNYAAAEPDWVRKALDEQRRQEDRRKEEAYIKIYLWRIRVFYRAKKAILTSLG